MQLSKPTTFILGLFCGAVIVVLLVSVTTLQQKYLSAFLSNDPVEIDDGEMSSTSVGSAGCVSSQDCPSEVTDDQRNNCMENICMMGICAPAIICPIGTRCDEGNCYYDGSCNTNDDCFSTGDEEATNNNCMEDVCTGGFCTLDSVCRDGQTCDGAGSCIGEPISEDVCVNDVDCPSPSIEDRLQYCSESVCTEGSCYYQGCALGQTCDGAGSCVDDSSSSSPPVPPSPEDFGDSSSS